ncbi:MAG: M90 family metallopeptidase [Candidatus Aureabacteria bacterium]|nr:M90 family metallopeptidase [Candidatus Auribacterota bacterium]
MRAIPTADIFLHGALVAVIAFSVAVVFSGSLHPAWALSAVPVLALYTWMALRRPMRRLRLHREEFPGEWRKILREQVRFYRGLDDRHRRRFEDDVRYFLAERRIEGVGGAEVTDEVRVLIAAGAAVLLNGQPEWELPRGHTILVYPGSFDEEFRFTRRGPFLGKAHGQGPIIISREALLDGWREPWRGDNVVLHEFAHLMDIRAGQATGLPRMLNPAASGAWLTLIHREMEKVESNRSLLCFYAAENEAEFFAVSVEYFFERPVELKEKHAELYGALAQFFSQDPAANAGEG